MTQATQAALHAPAKFQFQPTDKSTRRAGVAVVDVKLSIHDDLPAIEREWRAFEQHADCTAFQSFDWLSTWQRHIGARNGIVPVVVAGHDPEGRLLFLLPLAIEPGFARRLTFLGSELCDYNAPLLCVDFFKRIDPARFAALWRDIVERLQSHPRLHYDLICFEKMPEKVGGQDNPMLGFPVATHPSGAYLTHLAGDWEAFYVAKRSSATRRRDRTKRKRLAESGEVRFVSAQGAAEVAETIEILMQQKSKQFAAMGVTNIFALPGYPQFYRELATATRDLVHVSRLEVGPVPAAVNLGVTFRGCYYHVLASYTDHELSKFGPGAAHLHDLMRYAIKYGFRMFDFTIGDERYKREWCDTELKLFDHVGVATMRGTAVAIPLRLGRRVKRWIKQTPALWSAFSKARELAGALRGR